VFVVGASDYFIRQNEIRKKKNVEYYAVRALREERYENRFSRVSGG
jgi:hypothetical protein